MGALPPYPYYRISDKVRQVSKSKEKLSDLLIKKYNISDEDLADENQIKSILREIKIDILISETS